MAIICRKYNLLFIMNPRTACNAVGKALINELSGEYIPATEIKDENGVMIIGCYYCTLKGSLDFFSKKRFKL